MLHEDVFMDGFCGRYSESLDDFQWFLILKYLLKLLVKNVNNNLKMEN